MTLTQAAILVRKVGFWLAVIAVLLLFLRITISVSTGIFRAFFPKPTPPPTVAFGKLTPYDFSQNLLQDSGGVTFKIQTIEGVLPDLGDKATVFAVEEKPATILFGETARQLAKKIGFLSDPKIENDKTYIFSDPNFPGRELEIDVIWQNFQFKNDPNFYPELLGISGGLTKEEAIRLATSFLSQLGKFQKEFTAERTQVTPLKISSGKLVTASSLAESQIIRVGFLREDLEKHPILPLNSEKPNVFVDVTALQAPEKRIFAASYFYYPVNTQKQATYPIKSTQAAFEELQAGAGVVIGEKVSGLVIRKIYLAYLEPTAPIKFFTPVYVFEGDNFKAFVPAIGAEWFGP